MQVLAAPPAPPVIGELVSRDGQRPGTHRKRRVVGAALEMQCEQGLLHEGLDVVRRALHPAAQVGPQPAGDGGQRLAVGRFVTQLGAQPQGVQQALELISGLVAHGACASGGW